MAIAVPLIVLSHFRRKLPSALILFLSGFVLLDLSRPALFGGMTLSAWVPRILVPASTDRLMGFTKGVVAQLPLTLLHSVAAVCALSGDLFPGREDSLVGLLPAGLILAANVTAGFLIGMLFRAMFNGKKPEGDRGRGNPAVRATSSSGKSRAFHPRRSP